MVQDGAIYRKSARGTEALARRDPALSMRLRSLLIMVDGKRSTGELARLSAGLGDTAQMLEQLDDLGMIDPVPADTAAAGTPAPAPVASPPAAATLPLQDARRLAARRLTDLLGPLADDLCLRMEAARTPQDLATHLQRAEALVRQVKGAAAAATLLEGLQGYRAD